MPLLIPLPMDLVVDFLTMHVDLAGRLDPKAHLIATDLNDRDFDHVIDDNAFILLPREN